MGRLDASFASGGEKPFNAGVPETLDHMYSGTRHDSDVKGKHGAMVFQVPKAGPGSHVCGIPP
jgi:hypothetical protein